MQEIDKQAIKCEIMSNMLGRGRIRSHGAALHMLGERNIRPLKMHNRMDKA